MMKYRRALQVEVLEDRALPSVFGVPWPDGTHITLSFAPDGTPTGAGANTLFSSLDSAYPRAVWQREILQAFQTWAENANINIGFVSDAGLPAGVAGVLQGD